MDANAASNEIWHAGNFNPATKLNTSGGTITGNLVVDGNLDVKSGGTNQTVWHDGNRIVAAVSNISDPTTATAEDVANKINELLANLRTAGILAV
jgi:hypothetical protein